MEEKIKRKGEGSKGWWWKEQHRFCYWPLAFSNSFPPLSFKRRVQLELYVSNYPSCPKEKTKTKTKTPLHIEWCCRTWWLCLCENYWWSHTFGHPKNHNLLDFLFKDAVPRLTHIKSNKLDCIWSLFNLYLSCLSAILLGFFLFISVFLALGFRPFKWSPFEVSADWDKRQENLMSLIYFLFFFLKPNDVWGDARPSFQILLQLSTSSICCISPLQEEKTKQNIIENKK